ncbi:uncharacterized protein LOC110269085 isoform X2 [Arachis ipaensis]|uniref:uncharacterized protein LOC110269085 isoform X2 n=1 Tax=Arachis ipaensis TaxID=130454 RepID=UPI000A2B606D|nr:uncharacterized protein LOC110269085 isoform X2 [Arachis ipaensis]
MSILEFPPLPLFYYFFFLSSCIGTSIDSSGTCQFIAFGCCASNLMILKVFYVLILCWLSTWTRNFKLEWTTLRLLLLHHPLTHPNLRPFITIHGVALACLLARGPRWFARDESEQTWISSN